MAEPAKSFLIRLTGTPPPPRSSSTSKSKKKKNPPNKPKQQQQQQQQRHTLTITPPNDTIGHLLLDTRRLFNAIDREDVDIKLLLGFPPKPLIIEGKEMELVSDHVQANENVIVRWEPTTNNNGAKKNDDASSQKGAKRSAKTEGGSKGKKRPRNNKATASSAKAKKKDDNDDIADNDDNENVSARDTTSSSRPRRAAAEAATSGFAAIIKAQEAIMKSEKKAAAAERNQKRSSSSSSSSAAAGAKRRMASLPGGRRLADGATIPSTTSKIRAISNSSNTMKNEEDVSYKLLSSLEGGGGGKVGGFLRKAMKSAVLKSYEQSKASVRVSAVQSGNFSISPKQSAIQLGSGDNNENVQYGMHVVSYSKGLEGRGMYKEDVEIIGIEALKAVITAVYRDHHDENDGEEGRNGREMLRPISMAQLSPRVFWSLAHHYPHKSTEEALQSILPELDWSFLCGRTKTLSEKAKENLRQERVRKGEIVDEGEESKNGEEAVGVVEAVEEAMAKMEEYDGKNARERAARAAMARFESKSTSSSIAAASAASMPKESEKHNENDEEEWRIITPTELDIDELNECIHEGILYRSLECPPDEIIDEWVHNIVKFGNIHNWRELANSDPATLYHTLLTTTAAANASKSCTSPLSEQQSDKNENSILSEALCDAWIDAAQSKSVDEIMLDILDSDQDVLEVLREEGNAGTPKDLTLWFAVPEMLLLECPSLKRILSSDDYDLSKKVKAWCTRARFALNDHEWLDWYATPVN